MKTARLALVPLIVIMGLVLSACGSGQAFGSTLTPTPTETFTPTNTQPPTPTYTPTLPPTSTPIPGVGASAIEPANASQVVELALLGKDGFERGIVTKAVYSPDEKTLAIASSSGIYLFDTTTLTQKSFLDTPSKFSGSDNLVVSDLVFLPDGTLASCDGDNSTIERQIKFWNPASGQVLNSMDFNVFLSLWSVAISPDGKVVAVGLFDHSILLVPPMSGQVLHKLLGNYSQVDQLVFSPDGKQLATVSSESMNPLIMVWDVGSGKMLHANATLGSSVGGVAFSPDGNLLAIGLGDKTVKIWDLTTLKLSTLSGHSDSVNTVVFSPDGKVLASGSADKTIKLWDVATWQELATLNGHSDAVISLTFSPDGKMLTSGSKDGTVRIWGIKP